MGSFKAVKIVVYFPVASVKEVSDAVSAKIARHGANLMLNVKDR